MNIYDISQKAGVSIATVSRVINGSNRVSDKTRAKVMAIMEQENYTPNAFARGLVLQTIKIIGILCADSSDTFLANGVYHIEQFLRKKGYDCILCCTGYEQNEKEKYMKLLLSKKIDAVIMVGSNYVDEKKENQNYIREAAKEMPIIIINGHLRGENIYCTYCDDETATFDATNLLIKNGCKDIMFLHNSLSYSGRKKLKGYKDALEQNQMALQNDLMSFVNADMEETTEYLLKQEASGVKFDGVVAAEDFLAVAAIKYAKQKNLSIPEELQVVGYNNSVLAICCEPELTTVDNKIKEVCNSAVKQLMDVLSGTIVSENNCIPCELIQRSTTKLNKS